ncbi:hypothetical protein JHK85_030546 [Glycine max]|nr:hypothetical protein JHK85_030546 [Glycine max]
MRNGFQEAMLRLAITDKDKMKITKELPTYINAQGALGTDFAVLGRTLNAPEEVLSIASTLQTLRFVVLQQDHHRDMDNLEINRDGFISRLPPCVFAKFWILRVAWLFGSDLDGGGEGGDVHNNAVVGLLLSSSLSKGESLSIAGEDDQGMGILVVYNF